VMQFMYMSMVNHDGHLSGSRGNVTDFTKSRGKILSCKSEHYEVIDSLIIDINTSSPDMIRR